MAFKSTLAASLMISTLALTPLISQPVFADTVEDDVTVVSKTDDKAKASSVDKVVLKKAVVKKSGVKNPVLTTEANTTYHQLEATDSNLQQQIARLASDTSDTAQLKLASLKVQRVNVESQMQVVKDKIEAQRVAAEKAKADKAKADAEAKAKAEAQKAEQAARDARVAQAVQAGNVASVSTPSAPARTYKVPEAGSARQKLVSYAMQFQGVPYVWGGTTPSGFDCSGLTSYVYQHALGINITRTSYSQANAGQRISLSDLQPGDLIIEFGTAHVAMYVGNGQQIAAPEPGDVVKVQAVPYNYGAQYGVRVID